jgi:hypothetical protein
MFKVKFPTGAGWLKGSTVFFRAECPAIPLLRREAQLALAPAFAQGLNARVLITFER